MDATTILNPDPPLNHRFGVLFFGGGALPNPIDTRFQKVSGLNVSMQTTPLAEGGQNLYSHRLPTRATYNNLVLERGLLMGSPLSFEFDVAFSQFRFAPSNVLVTLLSEHSVPLAAWMFIKAYPVGWSLAVLDASAPAVAINTLELAYSRFQPIHL
jgi:phage tail-like protein